MKYKVGDNVKVRDDLEVGEVYGGMDFVSGMEKNKGKVVTISDIADSKYYIIEEDDYWYKYSEEMFESCGFEIINNVTPETVNINGGIRFCDKCQEDSIAYRIKEHFTPGNALNFIFMKCDNGKILVSKKQFKHLLELSNSVEVANDYELEFVDEIELGG